VGRGRGGARADVDRRFQRHWRDEGFPRDAPWEERLRFLFDHGSERDVEAVGRWLRDHEIMSRTEEGSKAVKGGRSKNEADFPRRRIAFNANFEPRLRRPGAAPFWP